MITRATLILFKKHPEIRKQLILQKNLYEKVTENDLTAKVKPQISLSRRDGDGVSSLGSILALNEFKLKKHSS